MSAHQDLQDDERRLEVNDLRSLMDTAPGRRFVWRLLRKAGVYASSFVPSDPCSTAFNEGRRAMGTTVFLDVQEACPDLYARMEREAAELAEQQRLRGAAIDRELGEA